MGFFTFRERRQLSTVTVDEDPFTEEAVACHPAPDKEAPMKRSIIAIGLLSTLSHAAFSWSNPPPQNEPLHDPDDMIISTDPEMLVP